MKELVLGPGAHICDLTFRGLCKRSSAKVHHGLAHWALSFRKLTFNLPLVLVHPLSLRDTTGSRLPVKVIPQVKVAVKDEKEQWHRNLHKTRARPKKVARSTQWVIILLFYVPT